MSDVSELKKCIGAYLRQYGFEKVGQRWMRANEKCILVFDFEKSKNSNSHYLRVRFWFPDIETFPEKFPHPGGFHMSSDFRYLVSSVPTFFRGERAVETRNPKLNPSRMA